MFPRWMYHTTETARIVASEDELAALGDGWKESPADFGIEAAVEPAGVEAPVEEEIHVPEVEVSPNQEPASGEEPV